MFAAAGLRPFAQMVFVTAAARAPAAPTGPGGPDDHLANTTNVMRHLKVRMMKYLICILAVVMICGCSDDPVINGQSVMVEVESISWSWGNSKSTFKEYFVVEGICFGHESRPGECPFYCLQVFSADSIRIEYEHNLDIVGESDDDSEEYQYAGVSFEPTCLRSKTYDSGWSYCIRIIK